MRSSLMFALANRERLIIAAGDIQLDLCHPLLTEYRVHLNQERVGYESNGSWLYVPAPMRSRVELTFECCEINRGVLLPDNFRFADDMTVRQLMATIDRKLRAREL